MLHVVTLGGIHEFHELMRVRAQIVSSRPETINHIGEGGETLPMNRHDKWSGAIGILIGLFFCISSIGHGLGQMHQPGPGFLPFLVGAVLVFLSAIIFLPSFTKGTNVEKITGGLNKYRKGGLILLALVFYNMAISYIGFSLTTFLFIVFLMKVVETQKWTSTILTALCSAVGFYVVFQSWLMLDLPLGPWGF